MAWASSKTSIFNSYLRLENLRVRTRTLSTYVTGFQDPNDGDVWLEVVNHENTACSLCQRWRQWEGRKNQPTRRTNKKKRKRNHLHGVNSTTYLMGEKSTIIDTEESLNLSNKTQSVFPVSQSNKELQYKACYWDRPSEIPKLLRHIFSFHWYFVEVSSVKWKQKDAYCCYISKKQRRINPSSLTSQVNVSNELAVTRWRGIH